MNITVELAIEIVFLNYDTVAIGKMIIELSIAVYVNQCVPCAMAVHNLL